jgi:uncharacterized membrane protein HdeD (DUF308 family)
MYEKAKQYAHTRPRLKKILGVCCVIAGVVALITPFTPGAALLLFMGYEFLGFSFLRKEESPQE